MQFLLRPTQMMRLSHLNPHSKPLMPMIIRTLPQWKQGMMKWMNEWMAWHSSHYFRRPVLCVSSSKYDLQIAVVESSLRIHSSEGSSVRIYDAGRSKVDEEPNLSLIDDIDGGKISKLMKYRVRKANFDMGLKLNNWMIFWLILILLIFLKTAKHLVW